MIIITLFIFDLDQAEFIRLQAPLVKLSLTDSEIVVKNKNLKLKKHFLNYFTRFESGECYVNSTFTFKNYTDGKNKQILVELSDDTKK